MSDEQEQTVQNSPPRRRSSPINPHLPTAPRLPGASRLEGGVKLDIPLPSGDIKTSGKDEELTPMQTFLRQTPGSSVTGDHGLRLSGPHFDAANEEKPVQTSVTIIPISKNLSPEESLPEKNLSEHLRVSGLYKSYRKGAVEVPVLRGVDVQIHQGEFLAIVGQSGSGKSTLLHLMGTLDAPDKGEIHFNGRRIDNLASRSRDAIRNKRIGMIFQFYHLLPELSTLENVLSPLMIAESVWSYWKNRRKHRETAKSLLEMVGLSHRLKHKPRELSGGEMQRAAIARALIAQPELLLADEPTGNLDQGTGQEILKILRTLNEEQNLTIVMVTHDQSLARQADRIVRLAGG
jgi:lipoprotein-releasing system ATP-binding protein